MNEEKKTYEQKPQVFYFNADGKLIVESNKGVWVDGEPHVKMYGDFICNAKTMGYIIAQLKGIQCEVGVEEKLRKTYDEVVDDILQIEDHTISFYCVTGASEEHVREYEEKLAEEHYTNERIDKIIEQRKSHLDTIDNLKRQLLEFDKTNAQMLRDVHDFNALPWYKRMFKKIKLTKVETKVESDIRVA